MQPAPNVCPIKERLLAELHAIHARIASIHTKEEEALLHSNFDAVHVFSVELLEAKHARDAVMRQLKKHLAEHGC
jgi:hypothetical protein